ncbi:MAG: hypothetical protein ILO68_00790 [Clostridia bacterium]|nr:hypothetical protein [Clostridia bacterium]
MRRSLGVVLTLAVLVNALLFVPAYSADEATYYEDYDMYFANSYFRGSSLEYNPHLATASMILTKLSAPWGDPSKDPDWYSKQPEKAEKYFETIGFTDFDTNEDYRVKTRFDSIGVAAARKKLTFSGMDYTVIGVVPRSGGYALEWSNNVYLGDGSKSDEMHEGWYNAANKLIAFLKQYIADREITGPVKLWMCGFSRGGAVTNIAAALIDNKLEKDPSWLGEDVTLKREDLFAYTFEAPQGANVNSKTVKQPRDALYNNIWNIINPNDLVPKVAMSQYGFTRFGIDRFITTEFYDSANYAENRRIFDALYYANNTEKHIADDFTMYGTPVESVTLFVGLNLMSKFQDGIPSMAFKQILTVDNTKANYDANIAVMLLLDEAVARIGTRKDYCNKYQNAAKEFMLLMTDSNDILSDSAGFIAGAATALILSIPLFAVTKSPKVVEWALNGLSNIIPKSKFETAFKLFSPILNLAASVYWERPNEVISVGMQYEEVFQNHDTEVTIAHLQAQDSYYVDAYNRKNPDKEKLSVVPLRENADLAQISFKGMNDLGLRINGTKYVDVEGKVCDKSKILRCDGGFAVGYYSYATVEKMELFFPVGVKVNVSMKDYSKQVLHYVNYWAFYRHFSPDGRGRYKIQKDTMTDFVLAFNSDRYHRDVSLVSD